MKKLNKIKQMILCPECDELVPKEHYDEDKKMCENCIQAYEDYMQEQREMDMRYDELAREQYDFERGDWRY